MKLIKFLGSVLFFALVFVACSKTNEDELKPVTNTCDTVNMKYSTDVLPILQANCYSCHGNGSKDGGVSLDDYNDVKEKANDGELLGAITHASGFVPMPLNEPKLSDCDINKIKDWINNGALNN